MRISRRHLWLLAALAATCGAAACAVEAGPSEELNPQPLPPGPDRDPPADQVDAPPEAAAGADGGAPGDGGDAGGDGGDASDASHAWGLSDAGDATPGDI